VVSIDFDIAKNSGFGATFDNHNNTTKDINKLNIMTVRKHEKSLNTIRMY